MFYNEFKFLDANGDGGAPLVFAMAGAVLGVVALISALIGLIPPAWPLPVELLLFVAAPIAGLFYELVDKNVYNEVGPDNKLETLYLYDSLSHELQRRTGITRKEIINLNRNECRKVHEGLENILSEWKANQALLNTPKISAVMDNLDNITREFKDYNETYRELI